jgi:Domain of unknown function (DUF1992)
MTERKPPGVGFESWVDRQIREAESRGDFRDLPGFGKPLPDAGKPYDESWWIKEKMSREGLSFLPRSLVLRKEVEDALEKAAQAASEAEVRRIVAEVNEKVAEAMRRPPAGPPHNLALVDVERFVGEWRARRGS